MDDLKRPTFWIGQGIALVVLLVTLAWNAARYPDRAEAQEIVRQALVGPMNPYVADAPGIARVVGRYDRDMEELDAKLDAMSQQLQDLMLEIRILARRK
jgi:hypothetical protein